MTMSKSDFVATVLENLGVLAAGQTSSAEDREIVERRMTPKFSQLAGESIAYVSDEENIPDDIALLLADIVARECAAPFGITSGKLAEMEAMAMQARDKIQIVTREHHHKDTLTVERWWGARSSRGTYQGA